MKLRILCLHGYNNTKEVMMFQMQNFINTFGEICEFTFLDGPLFVTGEKPIKYFVDKGIKPPFRSWIVPVTKELYRTLPDGKTELVFTKASRNYEH
jgi:hypothetical protein